MKKTRTIGCLYAFYLILKEAGEYMTWLRKQGYADQEIDQILQTIDRIQAGDKAVLFGKVI